VISRIWSLDHPVEIQEGMTFALETQTGVLHDHGVRLEEMLYVTKTGSEMVSTYKQHEIIAVD
jgi:Xaa-Pro aminopeptidase